MADTATTPRDLRGEISELHRELHRELQHVHSVLARVLSVLARITAGEPPQTAGRSLAPPERPPRRDARTWLYQDQHLTVLQLARLAGVNAHAMRERLKRLAPETAVAQGPSRFAPGSRRMFELDGRQHTIAEMAARTGTTWSTMAKRLARLDAAEAVSFGKLRQGEQRRARVCVPGAQAAALAPARPAPAAGSTQATTPTTTAAPAKAPKKTAPPSATRRATPAPTPAPEVIVPANVKRTVIAAPPGRFEVDRAPRTFGRIGHYEETGSAVARQYGGKGG